MNFYDLLKTQAEIFGDKTFLQIDEENFSYSDFLNGKSNSKFFNQAKKFFHNQKLNRSNIFSVATSGSTSTPKKLFRSFESWNDFFPTQNKIFRVDENSKVFMHGDLNFTGNLNAFLSVLGAGGSIITTEKFSPKFWLKLIERATNIYLVPTKLSLLTSGEPIKNIRSIFTGSQVLTAAHSLNLMKKFPCAEIFLYYGASELSLKKFPLITPPIFKISASPSTE